MDISPPIICAVAPIEAILQLASYVPIFPCRAHEEHVTRRGREVTLGPKTPLVERGFYSGSQDQAIIRAWWNRWPDALVGVPTGHVSGFIAVDYDAYKADAATDEWIANHTSELLATRCHNTLRGGKHYLFKPPKDAHYRNGSGLLLEGKKRAGLDLRADGGYIIWWPLHGAGRTEEKVASLPTGLIDELKHETRGELEPLPTATPQKWQRDLARLTFALAYLNPSDYDEWIKVGFALHLHSGAADNGFELWNAWSAGELTGDPPSNYDGPDECRYRWASFHQDKKRAGTVTVASLFKMAKERGYDPASIKPDHSIKETETIRASESPRQQITLSRSAMMVWQECGIVESGLANGGGIPNPTVANIARILRHDGGIRLAVWFDEFRGRIYCTENGVDRPWTDADDLIILEYINYALRLPQVGLRNVAHAVQLVAFQNRRNSVKQWLESLTWDGTERLSHWVADYLGCVNTEYVQAVGRNWLISMVARAFRPGCQADHMPVLEGHSGRGKSSALAILGGDWYRAAPQDFGSKSFLEAIQGAWLVEIPDMVGFGRREHTQIIAAITTRSDPYRAAYGRHAEEHLRTVIFAATSETDDYLQDSRGVRRYWPLRCQEINLAGLAAARQQLFAEAVISYKAGASWHEMPAEETAHEQIERQENDAWYLKISTHVGTRREMSIKEIAELCLEIPTERQDRSMQMRIAKCLKAMGFVQKVEWVQGASIRVYRR